MAPERDEDTGQFQEEYPVRSFLEAVQELENPTTSNVADYIGCSYDLAYRRLNELAARDELRKEVVGSSLLWFPSE